MMAKDVGSARPPAGSAPSLWRSSTLLAGGTAISRALGFVRELLYASFFGASGTMDAFFVALTIPSFLDRGLGEAASTVGTARWKEDRRSGHAAAARAFSATSVRIAVIALAVAILQYLFHAELARLIAPGLEEPELAARLMALMAPLGVLFVLRRSWNAPLIAHERFGLRAALPVCINICVIAFVALGAGVWGIDAAARGVLVANVLAPLVLLIACMRIGVLPNPRHIGIRDPSATIALRMMLPIVAAVSFGEISVIVDRVLASKMAAGSVSALFYAWRILAIPGALLLASVPTALFPRLAALASRRDHAAVAALADRSLRAVTIVAFPFALLLLLLAEPITRTLLQRGAFDAAATSVTAAVMACYAMAFLAQGPQAICVRAFHALQDTKTPMKVSLVTISVNVGVSLLLAGPLGAPGLALATAIAYNLNLVLCWKLLGRKLRDLGVDSWSHWPLRELGLGGACALLVGVVYRLADLPRELIWEAPALIAAFTFTYGLLGLLLWRSGNEQMRLLMKKIGSSRGTS